jgi:hypothetical protein
MSRTLAMFVVLSLVIAGCGGDDVAGTTTSSSTQLEPTTTIGPTTTTASVTTTSATGEPIDLGPQPGDVLSVIGVVHNDVLNVREAPGADQPIVAELSPLADDVVALGNARALPESIWFEIEANGVTGWANASFLGYLGQTTDETSALVDQLGELPWAPTMEDLGMVVAGSLHVDTPGGVYMSAAPTIGDLGEVTFDVVDIQDDAVRGFRVHVFATPDEGGFVLKSVEETVLCGRGVSEGLCL